MAVSDISQKLIKLNKMQIYQCYICKTPLIKKSEATSEQIASKKYESEEHIIPNSLGGYLTSYKLLCADCNSKLGQSIDNILLEQIPIAKLGKYPKNRDSDYEHKIKTKTKDGEEFYIKQGFTQ